MSYHKTVNSQHDRLKEIARLKNDLAHLEEAVERQNLREKVQELESALETVKACMDEVDAYDGHRSEPACRAIPKRHIESLKKKIEAYESRADKAQSYIDQQTRFRNS